MHQAHCPLNPHLAGPGFPCARDGADFIVFFALVFLWLLKWGSLYAISARKHHIVCGSINSPTLPVPSGGEGRAPSSASQGLSLGLRCRQGCPALSSPRLSSVESSLPGTPPVAFPHFKGYVFTVVVPFLLCELACCALLVMVLIPAPASSAITMQSLTETPDSHLCAVSLRPPTRRGPCGALGKPCAESGPAEGLGVWVHGQLPPPAGRPHGPSGSVTARPYPSPWASAVTWLPSWCPHPSSFGFLRGPLNLVRGWPATGPMPPSVLWGRVFRWPRLLLSGNIRPRPVTPREHGASGTPP